MTKRRIKFNKATLPVKGAVYAIPLMERYGAARVLARRTPDDANINKQAREYSVYVVVTAYLGVTQPTLDDSKLREIKTKNGKGFGVWIGSPAPADYRVVGVLPVQDSELIAVTEFVGSWPWIAGTIFREVIGAHTSKPCGQLPIDRGDVIYNTTQIDFRNRLGPFHEWEQFHDKRLVRSVETAAHKLFDVISNEATSDQITEKTGAIRNFVEAVNKINASNPFIGTIEREDILQFLDQIIRRSGLDAATTRNTIQSCRIW